MCGITGLYAFNQIGAFYMVNLAKSMDSIAHRGPDGRGTYVNDRVALGHRRLSIIDTVSGRQPFQDSTGRYQLIFNGEIFNYKNLRSKLETNYGVTFQTNSDTEVLLYALIHEGVACLQELSGFFAFAFYDLQEHDILVVRDRMGVKPLYYFLDEDKFIFASELKGVMAYNIPKQLDQASLLQYHTYGYIPSPNSIFQGVRKVAPGSFLRVSKKRILQETYYTIPTQKAQPVPSFSDAQETLKHFIHQSVRDRLVSDVPVGAFLSGGLDSSIIVAVASSYYSGLQTFTIGYSDHSFYDESALAAKIAKQFNTYHTTYNISTKDIEDSIFYVLDGLDEPFADASAIAMYILTQKIQSKCKVALSGDGADELLGGYNKHKAEYWAHHTPLWMSIGLALEPLLSLLPSDRSSYWGNKVRQIQRMKSGLSLSMKERYGLWCSIYSEVASMMSPTFNPSAFHLADSRNTSWQSFFKDSKNLNQVLQADLAWVLEGDMLVKVDRMSMLNGVEVREPMLDYRLIEFANSLPWEYKIHPKQGKRILREAFKTILPQEIVNAPKHGFEIPLMPILSGSMKKWILDELLSDEFIRQQGVYDEGYIQHVRNSIERGKGYDQAHIWSIVLFQYWWKKWIN